jgi:uncharacterized membrane protein
MRVLRASLAAFLLVVGLLPATVLAAGVQMTTPYPSVVADPGSSAKFPVTVTTDTPQRVNLTVASAPQGWDVRLQGGGSTIAAVTTIPAGQYSTTASPAPTTGNLAAFQVEVSVPAGATGGAQQVVVAASATDGTTVNLTLDINVQTTSSGDVQLTTNFPTLTGPTSTTFRFTLSLSNNTNQQITFALEHDDPAGWTVTAAPTTEANAESATVDAGGNQQLSVTAKAPSDAAAGSYDITVRATGGPQPVEQKLTVTLTGTYNMTLSTSDQRLNADVTTGGTSTMTFVVTNTGTSDLAGVSFTSTPPNDWKVTFAPTAVDVPAGGSANVTATIQASDKALAGDYVISVTARTQDNNASDQVSIRATVSTSPLGYLIGIAVIVLVAIGLFFVFQRYGRR